MNRLATAMLCLVVMTHYTYTPLAAIYPDAQAAARAIFYVLRGIEGACLFFIIILLRPVPLVIMAAGWGVVEELETAVCRLAQPIAKIEPPPLFEGLCGSPMYAIGAIALALIACAVNHTKGSPDL